MLPMSAIVQRAASLGIFRNAWLQQHRAGYLLLTTLVVMVATTLIMAARMAKRVRPGRCTSGRHACEARAQPRVEDPKQGVWRWEMKRQLSQFRRTRDVIHGETRRALATKIDGDEDADVVEQACIELVAIYTALGLPKSALVQLEGLGGGLGARGESPPKLVVTEALDGEDEDARVAKLVFGALSNRCGDYGSVRGREAAELFFEYHAKLISKLIGVHT